MLWLLPWCDASDRLTEVYQVLWQLSIMTLNSYLTQSGTSRQHSRSGMQNQQWGWVEFWKLLHRIPHALTTTLTAESPSVKKQCMGCNPRMIFRANFPDGKRPDRILWGKCLGVVCEKFSGWGFPSEWLGELSQWLSRFPCRITSVRF